MGLISSDVIVVRTKYMGTCQVHAHRHIPTVCVVQLASHDAYELPTPIHVHRAHECMHIYKDPSIMTQPACIWIFVVLYPI